jgi:hypothetical protein
LFSGRLLCYKFGRYQYAKLVEGNTGISKPDFGKPNENPHPAAGNIYFGIGDEGYALDLDTGKADALASN